MSKKQKGITLISLMIGLAISMGVIITMLTLSLSMMAFDSRSRDEANYRGEVATGIASLSMLLQGAGFGLEAGPYPHVAVAATSVANATTALLWRSLNDAAMKCSGVAEIAEKDPMTGRGIGVLRLLTSTNCSAETRLEDLAWIPGESLIRFWNSSGEHISFRLNQGDCSPFGIGSARGNLLVVEVKNMDGPHGAAEVDSMALQQGICLTNTVTK